MASYKFLHKYCLQFRGDQINSYTCIDNKCKTSDIVRTFSLNSHLMFLTQNALKNARRAVAQYCT